MLSHQPDCSLQNPHEPLRCNVVETGRTCAYCRYNLTGLQEHRCPECGQRFDDPLIESTPAVTLERLLILTNVAAAILGATIVTSFPDPKSEMLAGTTYLWAMLAPLQWVVALGAAILGLHALQRCSSRPQAWAIKVGMTTPLIVATASFFAAF